MRDDGKTYRVTVEVQVTCYGKHNPNELGKDHLNAIKRMWSFAPNGKPTQGINYRVEELNT